MKKKYKLLTDYIKNLKKVVVAFSSGVDSTFLLKVAHDVLGDNVIAVTAQSNSFPKRELNEAKEFCEKEGIKQIIFNFKELSIEGFRKNPINRCYLCKKELFKRICAIAKNNKIDNVLDGSNFDDNGDFRPGLKALDELKIKSPLRELEFTKKDIRNLSKNLGLDTANKPSFACLASRFVYGEEISKKKLKMVDKAEQLLLNIGFKQVRVRIHGNIARIEVLPKEFNKLLKNNENITKTFKQIGFTYVTMDLTGYRTGSMNETIKITDKNKK